jgi:hypothetical protein
LKYIPYSIGNVNDVTDYGPTISDAKPELTIALIFKNDIKKFYEFNKHGHKYCQKNAK